MAEWRHVNWILTDIDFSVSNQKYIDELIIGKVKYLLFSLSIIFEKRNELNLITHVSGKLCSRISRIESQTYYSYYI
jgi:hypothetical protein